MSDEHIDDMLRELRDDLMAVRPSPEFAVKVRRQVAARPAHKWFGIWQVATAGAAIATVAITVLVWTRGDRPQPHVTASNIAEAGPLSTAVAGRPSAAATETPMAESRGVKSTNRSARQIHAAVAPKEPEVLIPSDQRMALISVLASMKSRGAQVPGEAVQPVDNEGRMPVASAITVSPITIELLGPPPGGGSRERQ